MKEQFLKEIKFKKMPEYIASYIRTFKTKLGNIDICLDFIAEFSGKEGVIFIDKQEIITFKYSEKKVKEWIDYLEKIVSYGVDKNFKKIT